MLLIFTYKKKSNNQNEITLTLKLKDKKKFKKAISILNVIQIYITIPIIENESFFNNEDYSKENNIFYFVNLFHVKKIILNMMIILLLELLVKKIM